MKTRLLFTSTLLGHVLAVHELCGKYEQFRADNYTWNNNVWNADGSGWTCTYVSDDPAADSNSFHVSWEWSGAPVVRAFPNIGLRTEKLPLKLRDLRSLPISSTWELSPASLISGASADPNVQPNKGALKAIDVQANVCLDVFADDDRERSLDFSEQKYEIMIWFGHFGNGALPVGNTAPLDPPVVTSIQDTEFKLYTGTNYNGQVVHTWVANRTLTSFNMDVAPLFGFLAYKGLLPIEVYLGTVQFGTETFSTAKQVNFSVTAFEASLLTANDTVASNTTSISSSGDSPGDSNSSSNSSTGQPTEIDGVPVATQVAHPTSSGHRRSSPWDFLILVLTLFLACYVAL